MKKWYEEVDKEDSKEEVDWRDELRRSVLKIVKEESDWRFGLDVFNLEN